MTSIAHYTPSGEVKGMLRLAAVLFDFESLQLARGVIIQSVADELAAADACQGHKYPSRCFQYYFHAPETAAKVDALLQVARTAWMGGQ